MPQGIWRSVRVINVAMCIKSKVLIEFLQIYHPCHDAFEGGLPLLCFMTFFFINNYNCEDNYSRRI